MDISNSIRGIAVFTLAASLAIWLGISIVTDQTETILQVAGVIMLLTCILLGRKIWLLLIFFTALNVPLIRGFGTTEFGQVLFIGFTFLIVLLRRQPFKLKFGELEIWMLLLAACVAQVYLRNPVGLNIFGAGSVGARPYFMFTLAFLSGILLANIVVSPLEIKWALRLSILGSIMGVALTAFRMRLGGGTAAFEQGSLDDGKGASRSGTLTWLATNVSRVVASYVSPLRACLHPLWAPVILFTIAAAAASGYRNGIAMVGLIYLVAIAYRSGFMGVMLSMLAGAFFIGFLSLVNIAIPLPPNVQRALSPFPGTWEKRYVDAANESTEWRVDMWKEALFTEFWIKNKLLGDGLGLTRKEMEMMQSMMEGGQGLDSMHSGMTAQQEAMMLTGGYHSGPVQSVRIVGYVGLTVLLLGMIRVAVHAHRQIIRCRGTEWYPIALYTGIPAIVLPIFFTFIFGEFGKDAATLVLSYGMVRLLEKNLPLPAYVKLRRMPYILKRNPRSHISHEQGNALR